MADNKQRRDLGALALHIAIVAGVAALALGPMTRDAALALAVVAGAHLAIDLAKTYARPGLQAFLLDQAAHLASLAIVAALWPGIWGSSLWTGSAWAGGPWPGSGTLPALLALGAGAIIAVRAGGFAVALLMQPWATSGLEGLPGGGRVIGYLERGLVFVLVLTDQTAAIGFLVAAKSVLRFGAVKDEAPLSEYVIVGTLASFGWAILTATGTLWLMATLPPLGIPDLSP